MNKKHIQQQIISCVNEAVGRGVNTYCTTLLHDSTSWDIVVELEWHLDDTEVSVVDAYALNEDGETTIEPERQELRTIEREYASDVRSEIQHRKEMQYNYGYL